MASDFRTWSRVARLGASFGLARVRTNEARISEGLLYGDVVEIVCSAWSYLDTVLFRNRKDPPFCCPFKLQVVHINFQVCPKMARLLLLLPNWISYGPGDVVQLLE